MSEVKNILLVGVGGQGTILASKILTNGLIEAGYDVKMSEIHGMSQRGGNVSTQVRFGEKVYSPIVGKGEADVIVAFEKMEALRWIDYLKDDGIMNNAVSACSRDPRFEAVQRNELDDLVYSVDILSEPEPITSKDELDPQKYGVIVRSGSRRGLLLPDLDGVDTADSQIAIAKSKAGIGADTDVELERFEVVRYK